MKCEYKGVKERLLCPLIGQILTKIVKFVKSVKFFEYMGVEDQCNDLFGWDCIFLMGGGGHGTDRQSCKKVPLVPQAQILVPVWFFKYAVNFTKPALQTSWQNVCFLQTKSGENTNYSGVIYLVTPSFGSLFIRPF